MYRIHGLFSQGVPPHQESHPAGQREAKQDYVADGPLRRTSQISV